MSDSDLDAQILPIMLGTAGHVDHGKTSLVKHLTGFNTDGLEEEQRRGLSIDFAVAPCRLSGDRLVGIIDVPGHEDFIRNMVSGASSIDVLMLVVAADDAVMPQTVEHMRIAKLMGMSEVMVVITKVDLVDEEMLELVRDDISNFMTQAGFADVPMLAVSNLSGEGIEEVREALAVLVAKVIRQADHRLFRMHTRHVFSIKGYGTVVTGVPCSGELRAGESLMLFPSGKTHAVRAIQTYRHETNHTQAHLSSAINLRDLNPEDVERGMTLAAPGAYRSIDKALVWVKNESNFSKLKRRATLRLHSGTASVVARTQLINRDELLCGEDAFMQIRFDTPLVLAAGDKFILRMLSPADTVGGGVVLSVNPGRIKRSSPYLLPRLKRALKAVQANDYLGAELYAGASTIMSGTDLTFFCQSSAAEAKRCIEEKETKKEITALGLGRYLVWERAAEIIDLSKRLLKRYHRENKYAWGMKAGYITSLLALESKAFSSLAEILTQDEEVVVRHGHLALKAFKPSISEREVRLRERVAEKVEAAGRATLAKGNLKEELGMSAAELKLILKLLVDEGLVRVVGTNLILSSVLEELRSVVLALFSSQQSIELAEFRKETGLGRNAAVLVLEYFDQEGMTKRQGNTRVLASRNWG